MTNKFVGLKFTKNQSLILEIFFKNPEKSYYLRELGRLMDKEPGVFLKEINKLVAGGFLLSEYKANSRFFKLNRQHPLYKELKSIFIKTVGIVGRLKEILVSIEKVKIAFIFGSFAREREDSFSDVDLMIVGRPSEDELIFKIKSLEGQIGREINYHIFSPTDWRKKIKEKDSFIQNLILQPKIFLIGNKDELSAIS